MRVYVPAGMTAHARAAADVQEVWHGAGGQGSRGSDPDAVDVPDAAA